MNKLIMFPVAILLVLTFVGVAMTMSGYTGSTAPAIGTVSTNSTQASGWDIMTWDLTSVGILIGCVIALAFLVAFLGVTVLGSSILSDMGQLMLFKTIGYFGLYLALSAGAGWAIGAFGDWGTLGYLALTAIFALGFMMDLRTGIA